MRRYRFVYWLNSFRTEWYVRANTMREAEEKFREVKGDVMIIKIEEVSN